jgi:hypothetical protein
MCFASASANETSLGVNISADRAGYGGDYNRMQGLLTNVASWGGICPKGNGGSCRDFRVAAAEAHCLRPPAQRSGNLYRYFAVCLVAYLCIHPGSLPAQEPHVSPNAPPDKPVAVTQEQQRQRLEAALAPYIAQARATYPQAKARYLRGLPPGQSFFVTVKLRDPMGHTEMIFLAVDGLARDSIFGRIWNQIQVVRGYRLGDRHAVSEGELMDWLITKPDGSEEGNVVGKFLDTYRP